MDATMVPTRMFSLREANAMVPVLQARFAHARSLRDLLLVEHRALVETGHGLDGPDVKVDPAAPAQVQRHQERAVAIVAEVRGILAELAELGVEVKAADGLVDFRSRLHGRVVYLCWRFGEPGVGHWHELDAGFAGRQPLPPDGDFIGDLLQ